MRQQKIYKRFTVLINGLMVAAFDNFNDAYDFINYSTWRGLASIYDQETQKETEAYIII